MEHQEIMLEDARRALLERLYLACPGGEEYLGAFLTLELERMDIPAARAECICTGKWTAWSIKEHIVEEMRSEWVKVYFDRWGVEHSHPGEDLIAQRRVKPWRMERVPKQHYVKESVVDRREENTGIQTVRKEVFCSAYPGTELDEWLMDVPALTTEEGQNILPQALDAVKRNAEEECEALCAHAVPGDRYVDFRVVKDVEMREWSEIIPVYCGRFRMNGRERLAYISAIDPEKCLLPRLPETPAQQARQLAETRFQAQLDGIHARWQAEDAKLRKEYTDKLHAVERKKKSLEQRTENQRENLALKDNEHSGQVILSVVLIVVCACTALAMLVRTGEPDLIRFAVMIGCMFAAVILGVRVYKLTSVQKQISEEVSAERARLNDSLREELRDLRMVQGTLEMELSNRLAEHAASCDAECKAFAETRMQSIPALPPPDETLLSILRDQTLSPEEVRSRILTQFPEAAGSVGF